MKNITILLCLLMLASCSPTTRLSGIVDPNYRDFQAQNMVVMGFGIPLDEQKALAKTFEKSLVKYDVQVLRGLDVLPPTRDYSDKDIYKIAQSKGADTILMIRADSRDVSKTYVTAFYNFGVFSVNKPKMNVSVQLKNTKNKETIWHADGLSNGGEFSSFSKLTRSVAKKTVKELFKEGLIAKKR